MSTMEVWEQKLELAESISGHKFHDIQHELFVEDDRDFVFSFFEQRDGQTTAGLSYALVNAYWNPNCKNLFICTNGTTVTSAKGTGAELLRALRLRRPERKYTTNDGHLCVEFGSAKSELKFSTLGTINLGENYHTIVVDIPYSQLMMKHIEKYAQILTHGGKLVVLAQLDTIGSYQQRKPSQSKLDEIFEQSEMTHADE